MTGTEFTSKQNTVGGVVGILLLVFALGYRFFPGLIHPESQALQPAPQATVPTSADVVITQTPPPAVKTEDNPTPSIEPISVFIGPPEPVSLPVDLGSSKAVALQLKKAAQALAEGKLLAPDDNNALMLYQQILKADSSNVAAKAGLEQVQRSLLDQARLALEKGNENEATQLFNALEGLSHDAAELAPLREQLKILKQVAPLLAHAAELLKEGHGTEPPGANALELYRQVLALDASNPLASQGLAQIAHGYLDRALAAVAQDDFAGADALLAQAAQIRPGAEELLDVRTRVEGVRRNRAASMLEQANSALDAGDADLAETLAKRALAMSADLAGIDEFTQHLKNARLYSSLHPGQVIIDSFLDRSGNAPALIVIPTGSFLMGSAESEELRRPSEEPQREVKISVGFALGREEISVGEFREFIKQGSYITDAQKLGTSSVYDENSGRMNNQRGVTWQDDYKGEHAADDLPVIHISWNDANAYIEWLSARTGKHYRLPSEAEFEYALRAGSATRYWWGDGSPSRVLANVTGDGDRSPSRRSWTKAFAHYNDGYWGPAPARRFPPNPFGLYDVDGNVSEWVEDCWHDNYIRAPRDSRAWVNPGCEQHVVRGGSWGSAPEQLRSAFRLSAPTATSSARIGLRVARDL